MDEDLAQLMEGWDAELIVQEIPDIETFKVRCSEARNLKDLKSLCISNICHNMDRLWCKDYIDNWSGQELAYLLGPFDELPGSLVTDITSRLKDMNMLHLRFLLPLVTCHIEVLDISTLKGINKVLTAIQHRCKEVLRVLNMDQCKNFSINCLKDTVASLKYLQVLNLRQTGVGDDVLGTLGSNNELLRELYACNNTAISNRGVQSLCIDDGHMGKCKKLSVLTLEYTRVDAEGLRDALDHLPRLLILDNAHTSEAVLKWQEDNPERTLPLQRMSFDFSEVGNEELQRVAHVCPQLQSLYFLPSNNDEIIPPETIDPLLALNTVSKVTSQGSVIPSTPWLLHMGGSITSLNLVGMGLSEEVDLTVVGRSCTQLENMSIQEVLLTETAFPVTRNNRYFRNLKSASLHSIRQDPTVDRNLMCVFTSPKIKSIEIRGLSISDNFIGSVIGDSRVDKNVLSEACRVEFIECNELTAGLLRSFVCQAPQLASLTLMRCQGITLADSMALQKFLAKNKIKVVVNWT